MAQVIMERQDLNLKLQKIKVSKWEGEMEAIDGCGNGLQ